MVSSLFLKPVLNFLTAQHVKMRIRFQADLFLQRLKMVDCKEQYLSCIPKEAIFKDSYIFKLSKARLQFNKNIVHSLTMYYFCKHLDPFTFSELESGFRSETQWKTHVTATICVLRYLFNPLICLLYSRWRRRRRCSMPASSGSRSGPDGKIPRICFKSLTLSTTKVTDFGLDSPFQNGFPCLHILVFCNLVVNDF